MLKRVKKIVTICLLFIAFASLGIINTAEAESLEQVVPMLQTLKQTSANTLEITYDREADLKKATSPSNYWVRDLDNLRPTNVATIGKLESVTANNALTANLVDIKAKDASNRVFTLTFSQNIKTGMQFELIICFITVPGGAPFNGDNGIQAFTGK